jgi:hypothetical protein
MGLFLMEEARFEGSNQTRRRVGVVPFLNARRQNRHRRVDELASRRNRGRLYSP